jgi:hypothetical protein
VDKGEGDMSHWEQVGKSDEYYTPKYVFDAIGETFDMDVAAPEDRTYCHVPATHFITSRSIEKAWIGFLWMNPPFGKRNAIIPWLDKIAAHGHGIALTPDRTSSPWWQNAARQTSAILFVSPKIMFIRPDGSIAEQPGSGTTLFAYGKRATNALLRAEENGLGFVAKKITH